MATKSVTQFLRGLDLSGVNLGSVSEHVAANTPEGVHVRRSRQKTILSAASAVFPSTDPLENMSRLEWLKLRNVELAGGDLPVELQHLSRLEYLSLAKNKLTHLTAIDNWSDLFPNLRVVNCRKNQLTAIDAIPSSIFECPSLQVLDFSCNGLTRVPRGIENAKNLLVLNLSENQLTSIPQDVFKNCAELMLLDLSFNQLESVPVQLRRCSSLQQLILNRNPLKNYAIRAIAAIKQLEVLHLSATQRRLDNIPSELDRLEKLLDLDLSYNQLTRIPEPVFTLRSLKKLDVSYNTIEDLSMLTDNWPALEYLNLSNNKLMSLPSGLTRLSKLRKLYINDNRINFAGLPSSMARLNDLEVFNASNNLLENIPEGLCRCGRLKRLILSSNQLKTLPDNIHFLIENLDKFDVENNPNLRFPQKPAALQKKGAGLAFYNIDFSLDAQIQMMRGLSPEPSEDVKQAKSAEERLRRIRRRRFDGGLEASSTDEGSNAVLAGMRHVANERDSIMQKRGEAAAAAVEEQEKQVAAKRWKDALAKPNLDYSEIFDQEAGMQYGVEMWVIDDFYPKRFEPEDDEAVGILYDGDSYIVLETRQLEANNGTSGGQMDWIIFYWIGAKTTLDKRACAAMHAVNLRNFLGADGCTLREEQGEETDNFRRLFPGAKITVREGASGNTGFHYVENKEVVIRLYRLFGQDKRMYTVSMPVSPASLDPKFVYLLDGDSCMFLWIGSQSRLLIQTRGRLLAEKIAQKERLNEVEISLEVEGKESTTFWMVLMGLWKCPHRHSLIEVGAGGISKLPPGDTGAFHPQPPPDFAKPKDCPRDFIPVDWKLPRPILYDVKLGKGFLELLQVELPLGQLTRDLLNSKHVYLVDSGGELFVWMGQRSAKFLRYAGFKLAEELAEMMPQGCFGGAEVAFIDRIIEEKDTGHTKEAANAHKRLPPQLCPEGAENQVFRAQFVGWEPAMAVDFTRTAKSITERGADSNLILERDQIKTDLRALLAPRETPMPWEDSLHLMQDLNLDLVEPLDPNANFANGSPTPSLQQLIILDKKWVPVESRWFGHFFNADSYIVIARYWDDDTATEDPEDVQAKSRSSVDHGERQGSKFEEEEEEEDTEKAIVFFWQGREATDLAWLTFNFSLRKSMEERLSLNPRNGKPIKVEFKRVRQQQEDMYFLAHFLRRMVIHNGHFQDRDSEKQREAVQLYHLRANGNPIATRCIEVTPSALTLNSCFSYICRVPFLRLSSDAHQDGRDQVYIWCGSQAHPDDEQILESICAQMYDSDKTETLIFSEAAENTTFWEVLGGRLSYDKSAEYMQHSRLFRLSNDAGYFHASEKCADFCQDDLINDDVMMLDTGQQIYLWLGKKTSDVEVKLSLQAAKLYKEHMLRVQPDRPRQLKLTAKNAEPFMFRRCFHGWGPFYEPKDWSG